MKQAKSMSRILRWSATAFLGLLMASPALSATIEDVEFSALSGGRFEVRLKFDGAPPEPSAYTIERPARIALDFPDTNSELAQKRYKLGYDNASSAVILEAAGRTRVVLNLTELVPYNTQVSGNTVRIEVGSGGRDYLKPAPSNPVIRQLGARRDPPQNSGNAAERTAPMMRGKHIRDLDFRRGEDGEGRLIVDLSDPRTDVNVYVEGSRIKLEFSGAALPESLQRRYDVRDFATPVELVDATQDNGSTVLAVKASGEYDYLAYQTDNEYVLSVKPLTRQELEQKRKEFAYTGDKLSLNFQDIEVRSVLQIIADFTGLNLVASDTVTGNITLRLQNVPWDQALELILKTKGLDERRVGNVLMVAPAAEIAERERQEVEAQKTVAELAPLQTEFIQVRYADAGELFKLFVPNENAGSEAEGASKSILSERGSVIVDERTNSLLVTETAEKLEEFRRLVDLIDVPIRQVLIEARIVRANSNFDESLGISWNATQNNVEGDGEGSSAALITDLGSGAAAGRLAVGFLGSEVQLNMELTALETRGKGEVVSQPKIITGDKESATIKSGSEIPFPESAANGETSISFKEAVLKLEVTPKITPDDRILMELVINQDSIGELAVATAGVQIPTINTTELMTQVLVGNGETVVLGGIFSTTDVSAETKVPFFGDIPYFGRLFKSTVVNQEKQETLIFVTPRILADTLID